jgi:hypothetical protein
MVDSVDEKTVDDRGVSADTVVMYVTPIVLIVLYSVGLAFGIDSLT